MASAGGEGGAGWRLAGECCVFVGVGSVKQVTVGGAGFGAEVERLGMQSEESEVERSKAKQSKSESPLPPFSKGGNSNSNGGSSCNDNDNDNGSGSSSSSNYNDYGYSYEGGVGSCAYRIKLQRPPNAFATAFPPFGKGG